GERPSSGSDVSGVTTLQLSHTSDGEQYPVRRVEGDRHAFLCKADAFPSCSGARIRGRLLAGGLASTTRSCHDDPIADSSSLQGYAVRTPLGAGVWGAVSEAVDP